MTLILQEFEKTIFWVFTFMAQDWGGGCIEWFEECFMIKR